MSHCNTGPHIARLLELQCAAGEAESNLTAFQLAEAGREALRAGRMEEAEEKLTEVREGAGLEVEHAMKIHITNMEETQPPFGKEDHGPWKKLNV